MRTVRDIPVSTLGELVEVATPQSPDPPSGRLRDTSVYRGTTDSRRAMLTSLDRLGSPVVAPHTKAELEEHLLRNFIRYSRPYVDRAANTWELLVVAQHHGLPTRLMDWTYSPLVAAHFATLGGDPECDRVVWRLDWGRMHEHFNLPPLALMVEDLDRVLGERGIESAWDLFNGAGSDAPFVCMLEPPALDTRIVVQSATFTLSSDKRRPLETVLESCGVIDALTRLIIPGRSVARIRDQLDLCGIDERRLFPDLDGVAAEMRRYYAASAAKALPKPTRARRAG